jgi:hypothetical protein
MPSSAIQEEQFEIFNDRVVAFAALLYSRNDILPLKNKLSDDEGILAAYQNSGPDSPGCKKYQKDDLALYIKDHPISAPITPSTSTDLTGSAAEFINQLNEKQAHEADQAAVREAAKEGARQGALEAAQHQAPYP